MTTTKTTARARTVGTVRADGPPTVTRWSVLAAAVLLVVFGCAAKKAKPTANPVEAIVAETEIPEDQLLDVGIQVFDPGLPEDADPVTLEEQGIFPEVRKSEARFIPYHLKNTMESTGQWGAVRVVPVGTDNVDVLVTGEIIESTGRSLTISLGASDATGRAWFDRKYKGLADPQAYLPDSIQIEDPFQDLYNLIANDLLKERMELDAGDIESIHEVSQLRFAADLAPYVFEDYFTVNRKGRYKIDRLPAAGDPMIVRVEKIRERDYMLVDTLNEHYESFYVAMSDPYEKWRSSSYVVELQLAEMRRKARTKQILGGLLIVGAFLVDPASSIERAARDAAIVGGAITLKNGIQQQGESKMHVEEIRELAASFDSEITPLLVEVEGQTLKLSGSAEAQYSTWREILEEIFTTETGLPLEDASPDPGH